MYVFTKEAHKLTQHFNQAKGHAKASFVARALQNIDANGDLSLQEAVISESAGAAYIGK